MQPLSIDGDLDADIVYHEYGHGLTWRMIGRMSGPVAGAIGEGMSDTLAIIMNGDDRVAEYSFSNPIGLRSAPYTNYPRTYGRRSRNRRPLRWRSVRRDRLAPLGNLSARRALERYPRRLPGRGMTFTPAAPKFESMRDGILAAVAAAGTGHECKIWEAFAKYGVGVGAAATVRGSTVSVVESFAVPAGCPAP